MQIKLDIRNSNQRGGGVIVTKTKLNARKFV
jgi:hypothetical protein